MTLHAPQMIYLTLHLLGLGIALVQHGKPKTGKNNAWSSFAASAIVFSLLWWGGFFHK